MKYLIILACLNLLFASCQLHKEIPNVTDLRGEYLENPLGIDATNPCLF